jgi:hypothetical protein
MDPLAGQHTGREGALRPGGVNLDARQPRRDGERVPAHSIVRVTVRNPTKMRIIAAHHPNIPQGEHPHITQNRTSVSRTAAA